ncbi:MAG: signal peptidase I [Verrucomicrobiota bacterium]
MFGLFDSVETKMRKTADNWLEVAGKVYHYRRDLLSDKERQELLSESDKLRTLLRDRADASRLKLAVESIEVVLRKTGGTHYPKSGLVENVEFFLVAAIVILGIRTYFVQPFKIPTNSMWPSYHGMTGEVYPSRDDEPGVLMKAFNFATVGAKPVRLDAPASGEVLLPVGGVNRGVISYNEVKGRNWLVLPAQKRQYQIFVGDRLASVTVPLDFDFDWVARDTFFPGDNRPFREIAFEMIEQGRYVDHQVNTADGTRRVRFLKTGKTVSAGDRLLSFDILTGDQLFVDRISYHFVRPEVGDGFVFRTGQIKELGGDQYYIKRLVGLPGDRIEIREPQLIRNGAPITGAKAFDFNNTRKDDFAGYFYGPDRGHPNAILRAGETVTVPEHSYLALGDNSGNSLDGRYWGFVPAADVVGRPLFIYYPFTKRWGPAP